MRRRHPPANPAHPPGTCFTFHSPGSGAHTLRRSSDGLASLTDAWRLCADCERPIFCSLLLPQEQNALPGLANRVLAPFAALICTAFQARLEAARYDVTTRLGQRTPGTKFDIPKSLHFIFPLRRRLLASSARVRFFSQVLYTWRTFLT